MVKGAALFLQQGGNSNTQDPRTPTHHKHAGTSTQPVSVSADLLLTTGQSIYLLLVGEKLYCFSYILL